MLTSFMTGASFLLVLRHLAIAKIIGKGQEKPG
jgi:hypothetical protein